MLSYDHHTIQIYRNNQRVASLITSLVVLSSKFDAAVNGHAFFYKRILFLLRTNLYANDWCRSTVIGPCTKNLVFAAYACARFHSAS